jgi:hypothetical protein
MDEICFPKYLSAATVTSSYGTMYRTIKKRERGCQEARAWMSTTVLAEIARMSGIALDSDRA